MPDFTAIDAKIASLLAKADTAQAGRGVTNDFRQIRDREEEWVARGVSAAERAGISCRIDAYRGPLGRGWMLVVERMDGTDRWRRVAHRGPETWREHDWKLVANTDGA